MKWASGLSTEPALDAAVGEVVAGLAESLGQVEPDLVMAFCAGYDARRLGQLQRLLQPWLGDGLLVGCNGSGVIGGGAEQEEGPALALLAGLLTDVELNAVHLQQPSLPPVTASRESWWRLVGVRPEAEPGFTLLADPYSFDVEHCMRGLDRAYPGATVIGGLTSAVSQPGQACLLAGRDLYNAGGLLLAWSGDVIVEGLVSQGCRPVGEPLFVTACEGNRIRELDGKSPRGVIGELFSSLDAADRRLFSGRQLLIGLALPGPRQAVGPGDFLIREVMGIDGESGDLVVGARVAANTVVQFHLRDADAASMDLERELAGRQGRVAEAPAAALMFSCVGRGTSLYGVPGRDSGLFRRHFGDLPLAGLFCAGEVGPVQAATFLHGYSAVFGLIRSRRG